MSSVFQLGKETGHVPLVGTLENSYLMEGNVTNGNLGIFSPLKLGKQCQTLLGFYELFAVKGWNK